MASIVLTREQFHQEVWSFPRRHLCRRYGLSASKLTELCRHHEIPMPPRGYWARKRREGETCESPLPRASWDFQHIIELESPVAKWASRNGRRLLRLLINELTTDDRSDEVPLGFRLNSWESQVIGSHFNQLGESPSSQAIVGAARRIAEVLDVLRQHGRPEAIPLDRLERESFEGKEDDFLRLLAHSGSDAPWGEADSVSWDRWRRRKQNRRPDLRGADLGGLDLGQFDLSHARLRGANLSAANMRVCDLRYADLRNCELRHTDLWSADLSHATLSDANLSHTLLTEATLRGTRFERAFLVGTSLDKADLRDANLDGAVVWGVSAWDIHVNDETSQKSLLVPRPRRFEPLDMLDPEERPDDYRNLKDPEASVKVDDLRVAHFVSLLADNPRITNVIDAAADNVVLLLGRFGGREKAVLDLLEERLPVYGYVPVVFDFDEPDNRDTIETVAILAGLSRFVICNLSQPRSTPLEAHLIIPAIAVPFVPIVREPEPPFAMFGPMQRKYPWVLSTIPFRDEDNLYRKLKTRIVAPAEAKAEHMKRMKHPS